MTSHSPRRATSPVAASATAGALAALLWSGAATSYLLVLLGAAASSRADVDDGAAPILRTTVLVPAHDEERVVAACVRALLAQDAAVDVVVVADNCADATADVAARAGAEVWIREDRARQGKGQALSWALDRLEREQRIGDVVGVVDADCIASPDLARSWSRGLAAGATAVQADYVINNPGASASAARRWAGFALMHRVRGSGKERLGLSVGLFGTGMAFSSQALRTVPWRSFSVTEDTEYHVRLVEAGGRVAFVGDASVASPAPATEQAAQVQQLRWETGNATVARETAPGLLREGIGRRDLQRTHLALELLVPAQSLLAVGALTAGALATVARRPVLLGAAALTLGGQAAFVVGGLRLARAPTSVWRALWTAPALVARKVGQAARIAGGRGARTWQSTAR